MRSYRSVLLIAAAGLAACSEPLTRVEADPESDPSFHNQRGVLSSTFGAGRLDVTAPPPAIGEAKFLFAAIQTAGHGAKGWFHMVRPRAGFVVEFTGEVTCVSFDPVNHRAWIGGVVRENRSNDPNHMTPIHQPGKDVWFRVVDNGEGNNALPDRSSVYGFEGAGGVITSAEYCQRQLWTAGDVNAFVLTRGNIQVLAR